MRAIGPCDESPLFVGCGTVPVVGLIPNTPLNELGMRIEPAPSPPWWTTPTPAAAAAAAPPLDPPGVSPRRHGFTVEPVTGLVVSPFQPYSGVVVLPRMTAPAARIRAASGSSAEDTRSAWTAEPIVQRTPASWTRSLIVAGMPASGPAVPPAYARSAAEALSSASSGVTVTNAFTSGSIRSSRSRCSWATSTGERSRVS